MNDLRNIPLSHLRIFEVAGRRGAFTFAAKELGLTASAVSHSIRKLEELLAVTLFKRSTREISLTEDGLILLEHIQRGFEEIKHGLDVITSNKNQQLRVHSSPSFANQWLLPRLTEFVNQFPDIEISISSSNEVVEFEKISSMRTLSTMNRPSRPIKRYLCRLKCLRRFARRMSPQK